MYLKNHLLTFRSTLLVIDVAKYGVPTPLPVITTKMPSEDDKQSGLIRVINVQPFAFIKLVIDNVYSSLVSGAHYYKLHLNGNINL